MANIVLNLLANDKASPVMKKLGDSAKRIGVGLATAGAVAGAAAIAFGIDSVKAYAESEQAQAKLADAFARFPKLADTNLTSLQKLNTELAKKTRFDDDATAAAQATLAQYELTGSQIAKLTPLLQDYAAKTGKDLPSAAEDLGKAMLGQGRALKDVGVDFQDTGTVAGNFDQIMQGLSEKVGGFAEVEGQTAAGKLEILRNRFGEVQEKIGGALMPALQGLVDWLNGDGMTTIEGLSTWIAEDAIPGFQGLVDWVVQYKDILGPAATALGVLTGAQWVLNAAMAANPVGLVIAGLAALITLGVLIATNWNAISKVVYSTTGGVVKAALDIALGVARAIEVVINALLGGVGRAASVINPVLGLLGLPQINLPTSVNFTDSVARTVNRIKTAIDVGSVGGIDAVASSADRSSVAAGQRTSSQVPVFAEGGAVMGATIALIGEAGPEVVVPFSKVPEFVKAAGYGGDGEMASRSEPAFVVEIHGHGLPLEQLIDVRIRRAEDDAVMTVKRGYQRR
jgi:Skp family chaperone for outer membrane proteins